MNYYSENDPKAAAWLRELISDGLIPAGEVDDRSIKDVAATDLVGFSQCHFFAGVAGWSLALQLAGWPSDRPVWTGSCPCQPYSGAGKGLGDDDPRNLWPDFFRLIRECRPDTVFGEQVEGAIGHGWLDGIQRDLEGEKYAVGHCVLGAHSVGAPHIRQRLYWVADAGRSVRWPRASDRNYICERDGLHQRPQGTTETPTHSETRGVDDPDCWGLGDRVQSDGHSAQDTSYGSTRRPDSRGPSPAIQSLADGVGHPIGEGLEGHRGFGREQDATGWPGSERHGSSTGFWDHFELVGDRVGKTRRIEPGVKPLVDGLPKGMVRGGHQGGPIDPQNSAEARAARLKGYGNAINPETAAAFIRCFVEAKRELALVDPPAEA